MTIQVHRSASGCFVSFTVRIVDPAMRELAVLDAASASKRGRAKEPSARPQWRRLRPDRQLRAGQPRRWSSFGRPTSDCAESRSADDPCASPIRGRILMGGQKVVLRPDGPFRPMPSELTIINIVVPMTIAWLCWLISVFARWLRHAWRTRYLGGWDILALLLSA